MTDALLLYSDGRERHVSLPESRSPIPDPLPTHILLSDDGEVLAWRYRGISPQLALDVSHVVMARDQQSPDECPVYRQTSDRSVFS